MGGEPYVSIVIVNYNGSRYLPRLFDSLLGQDYSSFEVIVVDNNSSDNSISIIRRYARLFVEHGITFKYLVLRKNTGFCLGNNIGFTSTSTRSKYIVLLNNDTIVEKSWLRELVSFMENHEDVGAASSLILFNFTSRIDNTGGRLDVYGNCIGRGLLEHKSKAKEYPSLRGFFYASGCSMIIRRELIDRVKGFDPWLFMYHDDIDISWHIRMLGYKIGYVPSSICHHMRKPGFGAKLPVWKFYFANRNRLRIMIKNYELKNIVKYLPGAIVTTVLAGLFLSILSRKAYHLLYALKSIVWNMRNLKNTLTMRRYVQSIRLVGDRDIVEYMEKKPIVIWHGKAYLK